MRNADVDMNVNVEEQIVAALETGDAKQVARTLSDREKVLAEELTQTILAEAASVGEVSGMTAPELERLGLRQLNVKERAYYAAAIEKTTFDDTELTFPRTIFDRVFQDLREQHPLLSAMQFVNTTGMTEWIFRVADVEAAWWGPLCGPIEKQLENGFRKEDLGQYKLSAFIPLCKSMLVLAPEWLDKFVREMLMESIALGLEKAAVEGTGVNQPVGMLRDLDAAYTDGDPRPEKEAVAITDLSPETIGNNILAPMVDGKIRNPRDIAMIVNPADYWGIFFPLTTFQDQITGNYHTTNYAFPFNVIQSTFVPAGKMIVGDLKNYFFGVTAPQKIEYSDEYRFLEDDRVYITKMLANGKPMDNKSFYVFDISNLQVTPGGAVTP